MSNLNEQQFGPADPQQSTTFEHHDDGGGWHILTARHPETGDRLGTMVVIDGRPHAAPVIHDLDVRQEHQRKGVATSLWHHARGQFPGLQHNRELSADGKGWVSSL